MQSKGWKCTKGAKEVGTAQNTVGVGVTVGLTWNQTSQEESLKYKLEIY